MTVRVISRLCVVTGVLVAAACQSEPAVPRHTLLLQDGTECLVVVAPDIGKRDDDLLAIADHYLPASLSASGHRGEIIRLEVWDDPHLAPARPARFQDVGETTMLGRVAQAVVNPAARLRSVEHFAPVPESTERDLAPMRSKFDQVFERGGVFKKYQLRDAKGSRSASDQNVLTYSFDDPEGAPPVQRVALRLDGSDLRGLEIQWWGGAAGPDRSRFTAARQQFLRDVVTAFFRGTNVDAVMTLVQAGESKSYRGGSQDMPRIALDPRRSWYAGTTGESLIVGAENTGG